MKKLENRVMHILEVLPLVLRSVMSLIRNHYSLIITGTEGNAVIAARKSLVGEAKERSQQVEQVINALKKRRLLRTCCCAVTKEVCG